ncbi:hypothetical protein GOBAR_AA38634 [Gossypium barbadense]|uniref:NB-ARC domain-containing protein n=1 Tax=Gossypium barbadense TaxID=3634 RepID=A0A2P5VTB1_GOSBA|nr:hypothetical protein GOBAR_AA38634 [Gossypium barbadense]
MAESLASAAVENVTNQAMECASPYLRYFFCYGEIVQDFTNQRNTLKLRKQRVDTRAHEANSFEPDHGGYESCQHDRTVRMPGVGKTTLAHEVGKHAGEQKLFDKVVMFTMSQNPNINNIQDKVADVFGLKFQTSNREGRAEELFKSMRRVNKILVIVDDLWEEFELKIIEIPFGDDHKGCKILLTTRHQQVCTKMNCQKEIQLGILSEDEAWVLFRDEAGLEGNSSALNNEAKEVAAQCKGLPLAIVVVAKALKCLSLDLNGWRAVNQRFNDSRARGIWIMRKFSGMSSSLLSLAMII